MVYSSLEITVTSLFQFRCDNADKMEIEGEMILVIRHGSVLFTGLLRSRSFVYIHHSSLPSRIRRPLSLCLFG
uniref:LSM domain-containing protein n=1 Tax=Ascaris lumbricoides TaxID=6252 RepID=A0A0M3HLE6_ASCLU